MANQARGGAVPLADDSRSARKHKAILDAATEVFYHKGYAGTSMDEVAAKAAVSKQTVYKHFADKEQLFADIVLRAVDEIDDLFSETALTLHETDDLDRDLSALGHQFVVWLMQPDVLRLRRLIISEANRFPGLSRTWYERGFQRVLATLAGTLTHLAARGLLRIDDPQIAASQFMGMILWIPVNRAMFCGDSERFTPGELARYADAGVSTFLAAHRPA
jgi:TetR/AcrR family transcriptional regulator, mexJK operon transcriptional repressor